MGGEQIKMEENKMMEEIFNLNSIFKNTKYEECKNIRNTNPAPIWVFGFAQLSCAHWPAATLLRSQPGADCIGSTRRFPCVLLDDGADTMLNIVAFGTVN